MMNRISQRVFGHLFCLAALLSSVCVRAEVVLDGSLGSAGSVAGPDYAITDGLGETWGDNLFHSFSIFNIDTGETANFSGPANISNIITRVTGGELSTIDGALSSSIDGANLFLINPSGVTFGPNASLGISGSFYVSSADYLTLTSGGRFDATTPENTVLTVSAPQAFGFLDTTVGAIIFQGGKLQVNTGKTLSVIGGDITQQDTILKAVDGRINMASVASAGEIRIDDNVFSAEQFSALGTISVSDSDHSAPDADYNSNIHVSGTGGGTVHIRGEQLVMDYGRIFADTLGAGQGEQINIQVRGEMLMRNESKITTDTLGLGTSGDINVQVGTLTLEGGSRIKSEQWAVGTSDSGNINVSATDAINISGKSVATLPGQSSGESSGIYAVTIGDGNTGNIQLAATDITVEQDGHIQAMTTAAGNAGNITMDVSSLSLASGGQIDSVTRGGGTAGKVDINATGNVTISGSGDGSSGVYANTFSTGNGGVIEIDAATLTVQNDGKIQAFVGIDNSNPAFASPTSATQAGTISLNVNDLNVSSGAQILAQTTGDGQAGSISIKVANSATIDSTSADALTSGIYSTSTGSGHGGSIALSAAQLDMSGGAINVSSNNTGNAGAITANVSSLTMTNGAQFSTSTAGSGNGGNLTVTASGDVLISGENQNNFSSGLYSLVNGSGVGGNIDLSATNVRIAENGTIDAKSTGTGDAGNITVTASNLFEMKNSSITTEALLADGGNIKINADNMVYMLNSTMTAAVGTGSGNGGNIDIDPIFVVLDNSQVLANAFGGNGGNINIVTDHFIASPDSLLNASSQLGIDGEINIKSPDQDVDSGIIVLPENFIDASALLRQKCGARNIANQSSFFVSGRSAIPMGPDGAMPVVSSSFNETDYYPVNNSAESNSFTEKAVLSINRNTRPVMAQDCTIAL